MGSKSHHLGLESDFGKAQPVAPEQVIVFGREERFPHAAWPSLRDKSELREGKRDTRGDAEEVPRLELLHAGGHAAGGDEEDVAEQPEPCQAMVRPSWVPRRKGTWYAEEELVAHTANGPVPVEDALGQQVVDVNGERPVVVDDERWAGLGQPLQALHFQPCPALAPFPRKVERREGQVEPCQIHPWASQKLAMAVRAKFHGPSVKASESLCRSCQGYRHISR